MKNLASSSMWGNKNQSKSFFNLFLIADYLHQQKETSCSTSDKPLCRKKKEGKVNSGISAHTENLNHVRQKDKMDKKVGICALFHILLFIKRKKKDIGN